MNIFIIITLAAAFWFAVGTFVAPKKRWLVWSTGSVILMWCIWPYVSYLGMHP